MFHLWRCKGGTTRVLESAKRNSFLCIPSQHAHRHAHVYVCADFDTRFWLWLEIQQMTLQDFEHNDRVCFEKKKNWDLMMIMIPLKKDQEHWLIFINIVALGYFSKFGILSKRPTSETVFVKYLLQLAFSGALVWIIGKTASKRTRFEGNAWGEKTRESRRSQVSREITENPSSSCEVIILRNKIHGENIRVCMDYLRLS